ncbi:hypothetical protein [Tabrizicola soli]|uniref:Uncharacterized protein n=1 Tax=Tabrizicola soli TaxID=2185115 RepID=A0ABV7E209_9RHOB|nr:hypothetical protein [Tabrizicola soli]
MNRGTLPIVARLTALQTPARLAPGGARVVAEIGHRNPLAAILREVNETILARSLCFESGSGSSLTLEVAGRRVLRLTGATGLAGAETCLAAPVLEDEHKDALIKLLQALAAQRSELRVMSAPPGRGSDGVSVGLPVALLADLCLIELNDAGEAEEPEPVAEPPEPATGVEIEAGDEAFLVRFAARMGPTLAAWLISGGSRDGKSDGPEEMVSHLRGFLDDESESIARQLDLVSMVPAGPVCIALGAALSEGHGILCARAEGGTLLGVIEGDATQSLLTAWNAARG